MGYPKCIKFGSSEEFVWSFSVLEPLTPIRLKMDRSYFETLSQHPSGIVKGVSSVGTRVFDYPTSQLTFPINLDVGIEQTMILREFFTSSAFWFFPDQDIDTGYLVTFFPNDFSPKPLGENRFGIEGELVQLGKQTLNVDGIAGIPLTVAPPAISQQAYVRSGFSLWLYDKEGIDTEQEMPDTRYGIYIFPEQESPSSDWTIVDLHKVRYETNYHDRYERIMFNWVRSIKNRYLLYFDGIDSDFIQKIVRFVGQRRGRFYPTVNTNLADSTFTDWIFPPDSYRIPSVNVRVIELDLQIEQEKGRYSTFFTLEEI